MAADDIGNRFRELLLKWEEQEGGSILYHDDSDVSEDLLFTQNKLAVRIDIAIDLAALDANTRTIDGYVNEGIEKFKMLMRIFMVGQDRGMRKGIAKGRWEATNA